MTTAAEQGTDRGSGAARYIVCGAGAIGGAIGGRLHRAGRSVVVVARGANLAAIRERGLRLRTPSSDDLIPVPAVGTPADVEFAPGDIVLLTAKTQHSADMLDALAAAAGPDTPIVCCQNGVENERLALRQFGNVYGAYLSCPAEHLEPGVVQLFADPRAGAIDVGRYPSGTDAVATTVTGDLERAGFDSRAVGDIMRWKYAKLLGNLSNILQAFSGPATEAKELADRARTEALACYAAAGIEHAIDAQVAERLRDVPRPQALDPARPRRSSTWQSIARATGNTEADYLNGEIVLLGRRHGVPTPANEVLQRAARRLASERVAPGTYSVSMLSAQLVELATRSRHREE